MINKTTKTIPEHFSWMNVGGKSYITPVKRQGFSCSCTAFGTVAALESLTHIKLAIPVGTPESADLPVLSEGHLFYSSPGYSYKRSHLSHNRFFGWNVDEALMTLMHSGEVTENIYLNKKKEKREPSSDWQKSAVRISGYRVLETRGAIKEWLSVHGPLVATMELRMDLLFHKSDIYQHSWGPKVGEHCICICGYDDINHYWLCKNSWGTRWGNKGFFKVHYGECGIDERMWAIEDVELIE